MASRTGPTEDVSNQRTDVQTCLESKYRDVSKSGDKTLHKSSLLSTRLSSVDDSNMTNESYVKAKTDGDIVEAAKCFINMFEIVSTNAKSADSLATETVAVANQLKEETRLLLNELKNQYLRLKSTSTAAFSNHAHQIPSINHSPSMSPRLRGPSEDRSTSRDSVLRLDKNLNATSKSLFYQQLFEQINEDVRRNVLVHSIDSCDNLLERCRLMMLLISLFNDSVTTHGHRLLKTLLDLSQPTYDKSSNDCDKTLSASRPQNTCQYARSMVVLDAIPLIFTLPESEKLNFDLDELFQQTINYYSEFCLERLAKEYDFEELHEGLKKSIAARILAKDISCPAYEENVEENLNVTLNLLFDRFLHEFSDDSKTIENLKQLRQMVGDKSEKRSISIEKIRDLLSNLEPENDIPDDILFSTGKDEGASSGQTPPTATPPPKGRGRPKKVQPTVIVSPDDGLRRHLQRKAKEASFIFTSIVQHMFVNSSIYLRQTRSRILLRFDNPLANLIETEISKSSSQRSSRAKNLASETGISPSKKIKMEVHEDTKLSNEINEKQEEEEESPLESEYSKRMDNEIVDALKEVNKCLEFLGTTSATFTKLFSRFLASCCTHKLKWYLRVHVDCMIISNDFDSALKSLNKIMANQDEVKIKEERDHTELSTMTVSSGNSPSVEVHHLRALTQTIACDIQLLNKDSTLESIADLLSKIKQSGLLTYDDENYSTGNVIDEYRVLLTGSEEQGLGFLFFDTLSIIRYVVVVLLDILRRYMTNPSPDSDLMIGHAIVLSQVDWPNQVQTYDSCISWIRANKPKSTTPQCLSALTKFTYPDFFNFILDPNILEDFMALLNEGITLDIKNSKQGATTSPNGSLSQQANSSTSSRSSGGSTRSGKAITTRGVNKTFKEDLKVALIAQMKNSSPLIPLDLITEFVQTSLVPFLMSL